MSTLNYSAVTDKGKCRGNNEDTFLSLPDDGLWLVADGMGGHEAGEVASAIVKDIISTKIQEGEALRDAIQQSHSAVLNAVDNKVGAPGMGSTVVALKSYKHDFEIAWVGDSRAYLWTFDHDGGHLKQLTTDHSYVQMLLATGVIEEREVDSHPDKHVITQCLGAPDLEQVTVDSIYANWQGKQWVLLCSDGLTDELTDEVIAKILCESTTPQQATKNLLSTALAHGGRDNITLQIIESPENQKSGYRSINSWLPSPTGVGLLDAIVYSVVAICLALVFYWLVLR